MPTLLVALCIGGGALALATEEAPWRRMYEDEAAQGDAVIALWQFLPGAEAEDSSGNGHSLTLRGESRFAPDGLFGACLESFATERGAQQGASARNHPDLSPSGAFTLELWIRPKPEFFEQRIAFLVDKKNFLRAVDRPDANRDYQLTLQRSGGAHQVVASLGFGEDSAFYRSDEIDLKENEWAYLAFTYNGAGLGRFFLNGEPVGETFHEGRGPVTPGSRPLVLGDRVGSNYFGFAGYLDQVRLMNGTPPWLAPRVTATVAGGRTVFQRMEADAHVAVTVTNGLAVPLRDLRASAEFDGVALSEDLHIPDIDGLGSTSIEIPVDSSLKPGIYPLVVRFTGRAGDEAISFETEGTMTLTARPTPHEMPVVCWGGANIEIMREIGFTHSLTWMADHSAAWGAEGQIVPHRTGDRLASTLADFDRRLAAGLRYVTTVRPAVWVTDGANRRAQFTRVGRDGQPLDRTNVCGLFPEVQTFCFDAGASIGQTYGHHPAMDAAMIHTERRDGSALCFHDHDRAAYRAHSGREIPGEAVTRTGVPAGQRPTFVPPDGIVADDLPILDFYRWFWTVGDGWNELHSQVHRGLKTGTRPGFWTYFDPAVRCPPIWGSGGEVDVLSHWTYTYPDPVCMGQATDELFAMAEGRPGQQVMKMTQIIWYRTRTAPNLPEREEDRADWEREIPDARFITIAPDHLSAAFWFKMARPIRGIMYHGINSLVGGLGHGSYRYTHPESRRVLSQLVHNVVQPLGPALLQIPDAPAEVAMLQSFTSYIFGAQASWGAGRGDSSRMYELLQWARLPTRVVYEDTILQNGLDGVRVLFMNNCPVLPRAVYEQVLAFQRRGGIVVGDADLAPAIVPDLLFHLPDLQRRGIEPHEVKAALQAGAETLRTDLASLYARRVDSSDPDVIVRLRAYGDTGYLFAVNDRRTYGDYVGHHRLVMEKGLPHEATLFAAWPGAVVYDLLESRAIEVREADGGIEWPVALGPGEGRLYMISPRPLSAVQAQVAARAASDRTVELRVRAVDGAGDPLDAVVPVRVDILDPAGEEAEFSGWYGAKDGGATLRLDLADNDRAGDWTVRVRELASGQTAEATFTYGRE